ncbi:MAG: glycosyltransferase family 2 protein [Anaerolineae bacterium]|nr:glycosyltransferase family 2 protein [Anaerolineae bacterium]
MAEHDIGVTVVVPTLNRGDYLYDCLCDLVAQQHRPLEILVVDQSSAVPERVQQLVDEHPDLIHYHQVTFRGLPLARNYGWQKARYDAIVYLDDDTRCPPDLVGEHVRALQLPDVGAVAGRVNERGGAVYASHSTGHFNYWTATPSRGFDHDGELDIDAVPGGNFSTWKRVALAVGGIDECLNVGAALYEETEYSLRVKKAGYRVYYNGKASLDHLASPTGGCRVDQVESYVWALAHNRAILICRHLKWYQQPVAFVELARLGLAYGMNYRNPTAICRTFLGCVAGVRDA